MREKLQKLGLVMILFIGMGGMANGQTDSIYALNSSVINDTIHASFNSTYDISKLQKVFLKMTNLSNPSDPLSPWTFFATPSINSTLFANVGDFSYSNVSAGITKFSIVIYLPDNFHGQNTKLDFYLENNIVAKTEGTEFSNTLTYEYNAAITGITENNFEVENKTIKFYDVNGVELSDRPVNIMYLEANYSGNGVTYSKKITIE